MTNTTWTVVLDDDPTGTQGLSGIPVVIQRTDEAFEWAMDQGDTLYVLTNTRAMTPDEATRVVADSVTRAQRVARARAGHVRFVSRGDSTLRGHFPLEVREIAKVADVPLRGVLVVPAFPEAGRVTIDGVHRVRVDGELIPVADSEFARDATFGYTTSRLTDWVSERVDPSWEVVAISSAVFDAGADAVARLLESASTFTAFCPDIRDTADLETLAEAQRAVESAGVHFLVQAGPSYPRVIAKLGAVKPVDIYVPQGSGLIVVGSHTQLTTDQLAELADTVDLQTVELRVTELLGEGRAQEINRVAHDAMGALTQGLVVIATTRQVTSTTSRTESLEIAASIGEALTEVTRIVLTAAPAFVIAKGGITSHEVIAHALKWEVATVLGPLIDSTLPVWIEGNTTAAGQVTVIFPGNVGDRRLLARAVARLEALRGSDTVKEKVR